MRNRISAMRFHGLLAQKRLASELLLPQFADDVLGEAAGPREEIAVGIVRVPLRPDAHARLLIRLFGLVEVRQQRDYESEQTAIAPHELFRKPLLPIGIHHRTESEKSSSAKCLSTW